MDVSTYHPRPLRQVSREPGDRYRALHLGVPSVMAEFQTRYRNEEGNLVDTRTHKIDLNSGNNLRLYYCPLLLS